VFERPESIRTPRDKPLPPPPLSSSSKRTQKDAKLNAILALLGDHSQRVEGVIDNLPPLAKRPGVASINHSDPAPTSDALFFANYLGLSWKEGTWPDSVSISFIRAQKLNSELHDISAVLPEKEEKEKKKKIQKKKKRSFAVSQISDQNRAKRHGTENVVMATIVKENENDSDERREKTNIVMATVVEPEEDEKRSKVKEDGDACSAPSDYRDEEIEALLSSDFTDFLELPNLFDPFSKRDGLNNEDNDLPPLPGQVYE